MEPVGDVSAVGSDATVCLVCGTPRDLTSEHIIPQTLWNRFGINPERDDLAAFRTTLCDVHNRATAVLHERTEVMELLTSGQPVTRKTLQQLADWAVWVTLLLGLARGSGVLGAEAGRTQLRDRFDNVANGGIPKGVRVYAARVARYAEPADPPIPQYVLALHGDSRVMLDSNKRPCGFAIRNGPITASVSIGVGKIALLVVGRTFNSGPDHLKRLDQAAASLDLELIHPLGDRLPALTPTAISMRDVSRLFTVMPFGADLSLMPEGIIP